MIFPTDTLYGLGCDATNVKAMRKIYKIKGRPAGKAFPVLVKDIKMLGQYAVMDNRQKEIILKAKRPTTFILKAKNLSKEAMQNKTAAFRIPKSGWVGEFYKFYDKPIVATSANIAGGLPVKDSRKYMEAFGGKAKLINLIIFNGIARKTRASRIVDLVNGYKIVRK